MPHCEKILIKYIMEIEISEINRISLIHHLIIIGLIIVVSILWAKTKWLLGRITKLENNKGLN